MLNSFEKYYSSELVLDPYPPYHTGLDMESYFIQYYFGNKNLFDETGYNFIPVKWTTIYNQHPQLTISLQYELLQLDTTKKYFTVSQHDDAPHQMLPPNSINFAAGGNISGSIPIPLICSSIKNVNTNIQKDIFCSFVGSVTQNIPGNAGIGHRVRMQMMESLIDKPEYVLKPKHWSPEIKSERQDLFLDITSRSIFTLCPRGYGATSFRLYEAMQLKSIPVYIYTDKPYIPFSNRVDWNKLAVLIEYKDISKIDDILKSISEEEIKERQNYISEHYNRYFDLNGMCSNILTELQA
jgi:hypothetical protein